MASKFKKNKIANCLILVSTLLVSNAFAQNAPMAPAYPSLNGAGGFPNAPALPNAPASVDFNENYAGPTPSNPMANGMSMPNYGANSSSDNSAGGASNPSAKMISQSKSNKSSNLANNATVNVVSNPAGDTNTVYYNTLSLSKADEAWSNQSFKWHEKLYKENSPSSPAIVYSDHKRVLYPWISMLRNLGYSESKINLELSRLTPEQFIEWSFRIQEMQ